MAPPTTRPPSRPPLTSRIRASFEGKRSKSTSSDHSPVTNGNGANGFITQDPDSLRKAIDEAINSEAFQTAIAANLAKLIKPSIKTALDTIQPVVEAVYNHEVLLRKTNRSVENILERLEENIEVQGRRESIVEPLENGDAPVADGEKDVAVEEKKEAPPVETPAPAAQERAVGDSTPTPNIEQLLGEQNGQTSTKLSELSNSVEANNAKIAEVVQGISDIQASLAPTNEGVNAIKIASEQSTTTASVMQAQLDQLKADIGSIIETMGADMGKNVQGLHEKVGAQDTMLLSSHTTKLDAIATDLGALKGHSDTMEKIEAISAELTGLKGCIEAGNASNTEGFTNLGAQLTSVITAMEGHTSTLGQIKDKEPHLEILAALQQSNDSHAAHTTALSEIKDRSLPSTAVAPASSHESGADTAALQALQAELASLKENITAGLTSNNETVAGLGAKIDTVLSTVEAHKASDSNSEILAAVQQSNESHAAHAAALEGIKSLGGGAPVAESGNLAALEAQVASLHAVLDGHTDALDEIKTTSGSHATALEGVKSLGTPVAGDNSALEAQISSLHAVLEGHTAVLDEIKTISGFHATALDGVKSLRAPVAGDNSALESQISALAASLEAHSSALEDIKSIGGLHSSALDDIKTAHASHAEALDGVRSLGSAPVSVDNSILESQIGALAATLETHTSALDNIKAAHASHAEALDGVKSLASPSAPAEIDFSGLESQITALTATLASHSAALDEIKSTGGVHATTLDEIKATSASHATALERARSLGGETAPASDGSNLAVLEAQLGAVVATLALHTSALDELKTAGGSHNEAVVTALGIHASALDEIKGTTVSHAAALEQSRSITDAPPPSYSTNLSAVEAQIAAVVATLAGHTAILDDIKSHGTSTSTAIVPASNPSDIEGQFGHIFETLDAHTSLLNDIRDDVSAEILTNLQAIGQSQAQHSDVLAEIREADVSDEILTLLHASGESHAAHGTALDEIKSRSVDSAPAAAGSGSEDALHAKIDGIASTLESHHTALSAIQASHSSHAEVLTEIRDAAASSNESHADHALALSSLKDLHSTTAAPISTSEAPDLTTLETSLNTIITTLSHQTATLSTISDNLSDTSVREAVLESHDLLSSHTSLLSSIRENSSHEDIKANIATLKSLIEDSKAGDDEHSSLIRDLHSSAQETHSNLSSAIAGLAVGGIAGAGAGAGAVVSHDSNSVGNGKLEEILTEVRSVREKVEFVVSQLEINHTTVTTSITTLSDELKAEIDASATLVNESITTLDADLAPVVTGIKELENKLGGLDAYKDGVHFNDAGLAQLREHARTREVARKEVPEGMWFGSGSREGSPSVKRVADPFERERGGSEGGEVEDWERDEDEGEEPVLEAIPEVDTPLEESPVKEVFEHQSTILEEDENTMGHEPEPEISAREVEAAPVEHELREASHEEEVDHHATEAEPELGMEHETAAEVPEESEEAPIEPEHHEHDHMEEDDEIVPLSHDAEAEEEERHQAPTHATEEADVSTSHQDEPREEALKHTTPAHSQFDDSHLLSDEHEQEHEVFSPAHLAHHSPTASSHHDHDPNLSDPETVMQTSHQDQIEASSPLSPSFPESSPFIENPPSPVEEHHATPQRSLSNLHSLDLESPPNSPPYATKSYPLSPPLKKEHNPFEDDDDELGEESASASTSAITSPLSPTFGENGNGNGEGGSRGKKKKGKKDKSDKVRKDRGKKEKKNVPFEMEGEEPEE